MLKLHESGGVGLNCLFVAIVAVTMALIPSAWAQIDLLGEPHTVTEDELGESFVNSSETMADLTISCAAATEFSGSISGNIRLVKTGSAALGVTTANDFTGGVALQAGTINFTVAGSLGTNTVTISSGATLNLNAAVECGNPIHLLASGSNLKSSNASSEFTGDITGESGITFTPVHSANGRHATFRGSLTIPDGTLKACNTSSSGGQSTYENFYGKVKVKTVNDLMGSGHVAALRFYASENEWESFSFKRYNNSSYAPYFAANAISTNSYINHRNRTATTYGFNFGGNQKFKYLTSSEPTVGSIAMSASSAGVVTLGSEVEATGNQSSTNYIFSGAMSLVYKAENAASLWKIGGGASTMTGGITVERGILSVEGSATFASVTGIVVCAESKFSCTSSGTTPLNSVKSFSLASDATLELGAGIEILPDVFLVGGRPPSKYGWFTGTDNPSPVEGDQQTLTVLKGTGRIYVPFQGTDTAATWDGGAGDADTLVTTPANWENDEAPDFTGGLTATFATGGNTATFVGPAVLSEIIFNAANGFTLAAQGDTANVTLAGGVSVAANSGAAVVTNTIAVPVTMNSEQSWVTPSNTVLELRAPLGSESTTALDFGGAGTYCIYSTNTFTGSISLTNGLTRVYSERGAFGAAEAGSRITLNNKLGARLTLYGTTIEKDFRLEKKENANGQGGLTFAANTTNTFAGAFSVQGNNWTPSPNEYAWIVFEKGASVGAYFRPVNSAGGVRMDFVKASSFGTGSQFYGGHYYFRETGNAVASDGVYIRVNTSVHLYAPMAFSGKPSLTMANESGNNPSYIYLHGNDQSFGNLTLNNPKGGIVTPAGEPATFSFAQTSALTPRADMFQGPISLSKGGAATVTISSRMQATGGDLSVTGGTLAFTANGSLASVTNVSVSGASSVLSVASRDNLPLLKTAPLSLSDGGKVEIAEGVSLRVASLTIDGNLVSAGIYTAATLGDAVSGGGSLRVGKIGGCLIVR